MILLVLSCAGATLLRTRWLASNMGWRSAITFLVLSVIVVMIAAWLQWHKIKQFALAVKIKLLTGRSDMPRRIELCQAALALVDRDTSPDMWAVLKMNLAQSLSKNPQGSRAENIEQAICHYQEAQNVYTRQARKEQWAQTMINLGALYAVRIRGERAYNIEQAIDYHEQALEIRTRQTLSEEWANTIDHLAIAYRNRSFGERADNLEQAIDYHKQALEIRKREAFPFDWALTMNNLAQAYLERIQGERADNLEQAIYYCEQALQVLTVDAFPFESAGVENNLAFAYLQRIRGKRAENIEQAIHYYEQTLKILTPQGFPRDCRNTAYSLGRIFYDEKQFVEAYQAFVIAHTAVEILRGEVQQEAGKRKLAEENADLYACLVFCCLHNANADEKAAFEYAVAGKGRAFVDMLSFGRFDLFAAYADNPALAADLLKVRELRQQIDHLLSRLMSMTGPRNEQHRAQEFEMLRELQQQEQQRWEDLTYQYPTLTATQSAPSLSVEQALRLADELGATLVEYAYHAGGWSAFVVTPQAVRHVPLSGMDEKFWQDMMDDWLDKIEDLAFHNEPSYLALDEWHDVLIAPLNLPRGGKIVLAPGNVLHLIPLSIARNPKTERYLCDDYQIIFTPSLAALRVSHLEVKKAHQSTSGPLQSLLSAAYPGMPEWKTHPDEEVRDQYLDHAITEVEAIATHFPHVIPLHTDKATPQAVIDCAKGQDVIHFSCHGGFDLEQPEQSGLLLSGGFLTIQRIITELRLTETRLVTLSACETHISDITLGEENVGLVQALMTAGARCVVASLWKVPEEPTRVLFEHFYRAVVKGEPPATALQKAMQHVRMQPGWEHPFYWAAFQVSGLGF